MGEYIDDFKFCTGLPPRQMTLKPFKLILEVVESESRHFLFYINIIFFSFYFPVSVACPKIQKKGFNSCKNDNVIKTLLYLKGVSKRIPHTKKGKWYRIYGSSCASLTVA